MTAVVGIIGGVGGVGASTFAAAVASAAGAVLVDLDPVAGGVDLLLGLEACAGPRWSGLRLGGGALDVGVLMAALPKWGRVGVLSADGPLARPRVEQAVDALVAAGPVVLDLSRWPCDMRTAVVRRCSLVVILSRPDVRCVSAARSVRLGLGAAPVGVLVRVGGGGLPAHRVGELVGGPVLGRLRSYDRIDEPLRAGALPVTLTRLARGIWDGLG